MMSTLIRVAGIRGLVMEVIKLGKKGQVSIPKSVLTSLELTGDLMTPEESERLARRLGMTLDETSFS